MVDVFLGAAVVLMVAGVAGSLVPMVPGALLSIAGVMVYWWSTGYSEPGALFLAGFVLTGLFALLMDWISGAVAAKAGGASNRATMLGAVAGVVLFFAGLGPLGLVLGIAGTVFLAEFLRTEDSRGSLRAGLYSAAGALGSAVIQFALTLTMLGAFLVYLLL